MHHLTKDLQGEAYNEEISFTTEMISLKKIHSLTSDYENNLQLDRVILGHKLPRSGTFIIILTPKADMKCDHMTQAHDWLALLYESLSGSGKLEWCKTGKYKLKLCGNTEKKISQLNKNCTP